MIECLSGEEFRGYVGDHMEAIVFQVTDATGAPVKDKFVRITADPPGSLSFGSDRYAVLKTTEDGTVRVTPTVRSPGKHEVTATVAGAAVPDNVTIAVEGHHRDVEAQNVNGRVVVVRRTPPAPPAPTPAPPTPARSSVNWPFAAIAIAGIVALAALLWVLGGHGGGKQPHVIVQNPPPSGPTTVVDATARAAADRALAEAQRIEKETAKELADRPRTAIVAVGIRAATGEAYRAARRADDDNERRERHRRMLAYLAEPCRGCDP